MCGIAGIVATRPIERLPHRLRRLSQLLEHRGPDDQGFLTWEGGPFSLGRDPDRLAPGSVALVHRRLSIVDLSAQGWQPMADAAGRHAIVLNGEIYNHPELRAEMEAAGVVFRSRSDTEVLLHLLMREGIDGLKRAVGMFAFAYIDADARHILLARDPFGIKPLYIAERGGAIAFASEIRPLVELDFASRLVAPQALFSYLRHAVTDYGQSTFFAGIRQVPAGQVVRIALDGARVEEPRRYWEPTPAPRLGFDAAAEELGKRFRDSIKLHLRADVPVATTLSGGIDSSAIVAVADRLRGDRPLATFSYIADDPALDEEAYVDAVASAIHVTPRKIRLAPDQLADELDGLILAQEQPFTTTSIWAQNRVFRFISHERFKVVLDGQGADELLAGYPVFRAARLATLLRAGRWIEALAFVRSLPSGRRELVALTLARFVPPDLQEGLRRLVGRPIVPDWLDRAWFASHDPAWSRPRAEDCGGSVLASDLHDATFASSLPMLLRFADRNAMAVSVENRVPFLVPALAEFCLSLPDEFLIGPDGGMKRLLRAAMRGTVPEVVLERRDKIGFATPEARWFAASPALKQLLRDAAGEKMPACFAPDLPQRLRAVADGSAPYGAEIWRCWNVLRWATLMRAEFAP
jgi:asparagine synthase (glutamine-hydrolysing)